MKSAIDHYNKTILIYQPQHHDELARFMNLLKFTGKSCGVDEVRKNTGERGSPYGICFVKWCA